MINEQYQETENPRPKEVVYVGQRSGSRAWSSARRSHDHLVWLREWQVEELRAGANISEQILALAATDEKVRMNLIDFLGEWDFSRLRRITRGILVDLGESRTGQRKWCDLVGQPRRNVSGSWTVRISATDTISALSAHIRRLKMLLMKIL
jgi:hypothetical protein